MKIEPPIEPFAFFKPRLNTLISNKFTRKNPPYFFLVNLSDTLSNSRNNRERKPKRTKSAISHTHKIKGSKIKGSAKIKGSGFAFQYFVEQ